MAKNLVIVESPSKAKTINKILGKQYKVEASMGHVRDLPKSKLGVDVENNFEPHYITIMKARKTVKALKAAAKGMEGIFLAPDPDREGEAISWHLAFLLKESGATIKRVVFNEITREAITNAFQNPKEIDVDLVNSQQARRILDRILGYGLSPLLWKKVGKGLSAGRVQSIALRLIVEREKEIKDFTPVEYWVLKAMLSSKREEEKETIFEAKLDKIDGKPAELTNEKITTDSKVEIEKESFEVEQVSSKKRKRKPSAPLTTSKLQQESYNRYRFPASKTMRVAQKLYEGIDLGDLGTVGLITYMRTDSVHISNQASAEAKKYILETFGNEYYPEKPNFFKSKAQAQEAHEAIRPSSVYRTPEEVRQYLDADQYKIYGLIWRRFISSQMTEALDNMHTILIKAGPRYQFKSTGTENLFPGFSIVYLADTKLQKDEKKKVKKDEDDGKKVKEEKQQLPLLVEKEILDLHELLGTQHFTKPPARYNDASLVKVLEEKGIGRPSTYAPTIFTLLYRGYCERKGGAFVPTEIAEIVIPLLVEHFPTVLDYDFTAFMEGELDKIEEGKVDWVQVLKDFYKPFDEQLEHAKENMKNMKPEPVPTDQKCEDCGKVMMIRWGRFGQFLACSGFPDCKKTASLPTDVPCPEKECEGQLTKRRSGKGRSFYGCTNYPTCTHTTNKLPKKEESSAEDEEASTESESEES